MLLKYFQSLSRIAFIGSAFICLFLMNTQSFEITSPYISNVYPYLVLACLSSVVIAFYPNTVVGLPALVYNFIIGSITFLLAYQGIRLYYFSTADALNAKWLVIKYAWTPARFKRAFVF